MKKSLLILISCLVSSCDLCTPVTCHAWTREEIWQLKQADSELPAESPLHALIKNYEALCV